MRRSHLILLILFNVFWAAIMSVNKELEHHLSYSSIVSWRFGLAALGCILLWPWLPGPTPQGGAWVRSVVMGLVVFVVGQRLQVHGNLLGTAGNSSVLMGFEPILTSLAAALFLKERIPLARWIGFCFCLVGLVFLNRVWSPGFHWTGLWPSFVFLSSFLCESVYSILGKPLSRSTSPYKVVAISLIAGTLFNFALDGGTSIQEARGLPWQGWMWMLYLSLLCTLVGYTLWLLVLVESDVNLAALTVFVQPVAGVLIAWAWLGETLHWGQLWGTLAVGCGLLVGMMSPGTKAQVSCAERAD